MINLSTTPKNTFYNNTAKDREHNIYTEEYFGGSDCFIYIDKTRYENDSSFAGFYEWKQIQERLEKKDIFLEKIMFDIRTSWIDKENIEKLNKKNIDDFLETWFLKLEDNKICLTEKSYSLVDFIIKKII